MTLPDSPPTDPVTLVVRRRIRPGQEGAYEEALQRLGDLLTRVPGFRGNGILRPTGGSGEYTVVARFDSLGSAAAWELSPERGLWLDTISGLVDDQLSFERQPGLDFWFTPPAAPTLRQPPRWKMALLTLLVLYPVSVGVTLLLLPHVASWPLGLRALAQMLVIVPSMTYLFMPLATRAAARWLTP
ncbi:antibiotic biosynthesis monooxygenase [Deinococcus sp. KSM4-11]|uniref:antibiotic biosynthesis monooxygenase n=1 Tax=Deinococcus sp. KSM4-11 TaxID=2568654 RepID=UPI001F0EEE84|nr:antibiotic biosynthesis monooxygenase [Deinococcus sp. KSM4-11]